MLELLQHAVSDDKTTNSPTVNRATRIKLLEFDVKQATLELEATQTNYKYYEELAQAGISSFKYSELTEAKLSLTRAQAKLDKAKLLLDAEYQIAPTGANDSGQRGD
jgi:multidrug resistance efflux pump